MRTLLTVASLALWLGASGPPPRIVSIQTTPTNRTVEIRWESVPGAEYELERLGDAGFTPDAPWEWVPLLSLQATGLVSSAIDQVPTNVQQRFYRVALLGPGTNDTQAPLVEFEGGEILNGPDQSTRLTLTFLATDDTGVESVTVLEGTNVLGEATTTNGTE